MTPDIPAWLEPYRGKRLAIFRDLGDDILWRVAEVPSLGASPTAVAEYLGVAQSTMSRRFILAGITTERRDPWERTRGDVTLLDKRAVYFQHCSRIEQALRFRLEPCAGEEDDPYAELVCMSDLHYGSSEFDYPRFMRLIEWLEQHPAVGIGILGDLWDMKTAQGPGVQYGGVTLSFDDCRQLLRDDLRGVAPQIKFVLRGNHDERMAKSTKVDIDPVKWLCEDLKLPYLGYEGYCVVEVGEQRYTLYVHHGTGSGQTKGAIWNTLKRMAENNQADCVVMGHRHHLGSDTHSTRIVDAQDTVGVKEVPLVCAGSFQRSISGSYAVDKNMSPAVLGAASLHLYAQRKAVHPRV